MATYKVIQDIEAEDKILGPLTLRQFIYALIMSFFLYLCFISVAKGFAWALSFLLPPALFTGFLAFPFGRDQPTEVWAVARFSFLFKPRKRIWDQDGVKELVTITVPKKIERVYTNGLTQTEVHSRLSALATTIDSRGWAIKNVNVNLYSQPALLSDNDSDRLVSMSSMPTIVPDYNIQPSDDMLDENSSPIAQQFTQMITASEQAHRQRLIESMKPTPAVPVVPQDQWFQNTSAAPQVLESSAYAPVPATTATPSQEDIALLEKIKADNSSTDTYNSHLHTILPLSEQKTEPQPEAQLEPVQPQNTVEPVATKNPNNVYLAQNNDRNIASLAREANAVKRTDNLDQDEVVVSLR